MSTKPLTEPEILALLTAELTPDANDFAQWGKMYVGDDRAGFWCLRNGMQVECEEFGKGWVITSGPSKRPNPPICQGVGPTIPAAIADFHAKAATETVLSYGYSNVEAAIYAAAFVAYMERGFPQYEDFGQQGWATLARRYAKSMVEIHRATIK